VINSASGIFKGRTIAPAPTPFDTGVEKPMVFKLEIWFSGFWFLYGF